MIDTREALQNPDDPDSGMVRKGISNDVGGAAKTRRRYDTPVRETLQDSLGDFSSAIDKLNIERGKVGARLNRLESTDSRVRDIELTSKELLSQFRDADLAEVITDLRRQETVQQAALQMASRTLNQSLVNFL
jgi:flagellin-like hook-associated protein FlgL